MKLDAYLEKYLAKFDFDTFSPGKEPIQVIVRQKQPSHVSRATFVFAPWQSQEVMQRWILK